MTLATSTSTTSDIILPVASLAVAVLVGLAGVWVAYAAGFPQQRLLYWIPAAVPLVNVPQGSGNKLQLRYKQAEVAQPHLLSVQLISRGRKDIPSTSFDGHKPLSLNLGVPIIDIIRIEQIIRGRDLPQPKISFDRNILEIGPTLFGKRQVIIITLLLDGRPVPLKPNAPLTDVNVRKRRRLPTFLNGNFVVGIATTMIIASVAFIVLAVLAANGIYMPQTTPSFESNSKAVAAVVNVLLSNTTEQIYIALASIAVLLAVLAAVTAWALRRSARAPWWL